MPTDQQLRASAGVHPVTEAFAKELHLQAAGRLDGERLPPGAWESLPDDLRAVFRDKARGWIDRALVGGVGVTDLRQRPSNSLL